MTNFSFLNELMTIGSKKDFKASSNPGLQPIKTANF